jgi:micrococcal nuclease
MIKKALVYFFLPFALFGAAAAEAAPKLYTVQRVIDGDTFKLSNGERVRLIGVDTPETKLNDKLKRDARRTNQDARTIIAMGRQSKDFSKKLLEGKRVRLEFDAQRRDRYGRMLAYVYLKDGTFVNAELLKQGYAQLMTVPPNVRHKDLFVRMQREAREKQRGLWRVGT